MTTPPSTRFPALPTPQACLAALLSPIPTAGSVGHDLLAPAPPSSASHPSPPDIAGDDRTKTWQPMEILLPSSPPESPVVGVEGEIGFRNTATDLPPDPADTSSLADAKVVPPVVVEIAGLDVEDRQQMDELMGLASSKAACGQ